MNKLKKKQILVVTSTFPTFLEGDATPAFVYELCKQLREDFDVIVLAPFSPNCEEVETQNGIHIIRFKYWCGKRLLSDGAILPNLKQNPLFVFQLPFFFLFQLLAIAKTIRKNRIALIHAHWFIPQGLTSAFYKQFINRDIPLLVSSHGSDVFGLQGKIFNTLREFIVSKCNRLTVVGPEIKRRIEEMKVNTSCSVIPMGLDIKKFRNFRKRDGLPRKVLFVGRLAAEKRVMDLVDAFGFLKNKALTLTIVGDGPEKCTIENRLNRHDRPNVTMLGAIPHSNIPEIMEQHDIFILPSEREGMPVSLIEAMAAGLICIGSDIPQIKDIIQDGENGFLFKLGDSEGLANVIEAVVANSRLHELRKQSTKTSQDYDWNRISQQFKAVINDIL